MGRTQVNSSPQSSFSIGLSYGLMVFSKGRYEQNKKMTINKKLNINGKDEHKQRMRT